MNTDDSTYIEALTKLRERWRRQGIPLADRIEASVVRERLGGVGKQVSGDIVKMYSTIGGMLNSEMDDVYFSLWPLDDAIDRNRGDSSEHWHFGDHLIESFWYVAVYQNPNESSAAMLHGQEESPFALAKTLEGFFKQFAEASTEEERLRVVL